MSKNNFLVPGFRFAGIKAGIKKADKPDLALIYSEVPSVAAAAFTTNLTQAAPVTVSMKNIASGTCRAVVVNSGNANACTGPRGLKDAVAMTRAVAKALKVSERQVLVCSTGKIGVPMPMGKILSKIPAAAKALSPDGLLDAAEAILTTDNGIKVARASGKISGKTYAIAGFAKGAGMIAPEMKVGHATMLAYVLTDALVSKDVLTALFKKSVADTFNRVTVDGDMSTNDTAVVIANGLAGNRPFKAASAAGRKFAANLNAIMDSLARQMVMDGEGATKCVAIEVKGMKNEADAKKIAFTVANSPLVKTSFFGQDPNWGRILGAAGRAGATLKPDKVDIFYGKVCVARKGRSTGEAADRKAKGVMKHPAFTVTVDGHLGRGAFRVYSSDLTLEYVKINSCYRT
ncbi:MAG TPA: bifunctional glutamate N-acetyltransferase/amino-acid acetyltransferase ArgJ [bacterium]|nr:bifunctional glutamate N-acetyltransferase/amino-acid acetyltransferase ArgJ [bacterium]